MAVGGRRWMLGLSVGVLVWAGCSGGLPLRKAPPEPLPPPPTGSRTLQREAPADVVPVSQTTPSPEGVVVVEPPPEPEVIDPQLPPPLEAAPEPEVLKPPPEGVDLTSYYPLPKGERRVKRGELEVVAINTGERRRVRLYDGRGRMRSAALQQLSRVCRDHRRDRKRTMDRRLAAVLYAIGQTYGRPLHLVSGYRVPTRRDRKRRRRGKRGSRHGTGEAADIRVPGVPAADVAYMVRAHFERVGVGYYPTSGFVHVDVRNQSYYWIDRSGPGERQQLVPQDIKPAPKPGSDWTVKSSRRLPKALRP